MDSFPGEKLGGGRGRAVITASSSTEYAFGDQLADDRNRQPSVFTAALVEGLATGEADRDEDGWVGLNELYDYVFDRFVNRIRTRRRAVMSKCRVICTWPVVGADAFARCPVRRICTPR
jgi:hypothetical protein